MSRDYSTLGLSFRELCNANHIRNEQSYEGCEKWQGVDWGNAIAGEVGELCNLIKKHKRDGNINILDIGRELADVIVYADIIAQHYGLSLEEMVIMKFNEVSDRISSEIRL